MKLLHILPWFYPQRDGVGEFALALALALRDLGVESRFVVASADWQGPPTVEGFSVQRLSSPDASGLRGVLNASVQAGEIPLLNYVGYGYAHNGAPDWVGEGMAGSLARGNVRVFVHEPWASGPPWKRVFWTAAKQKESLCRVLEPALMAGFSCGKFMEAVRTLPVQRPMTRLPLLIRPVKDVPVKLDSGRWLLLGQTEPRLRGVVWMSRLIREAHRAGVLKKLVLAGRTGPGTERAEEASARILPKEAIETVYDFDPEHLPEALRNCGIALQHTQTTYLAKSTSFLLSLQLGQLPVARWETEPDQPMKVGTHLLACRVGKESALINDLRNGPKVQEMQIAARELYASYYSPTRVAAAWKLWLGGSS
jgi:hypothetical protein